MFSRHAFLICVIWRSICSHCHLSLYGAWLAFSPNIRGSPLNSDPNVKAGCKRSLNFTIYPILCPINLRQQTSDGTDQYARCCLHLIGWLSHMANPAVYRSRFRQAVTGRKDWQRQMLTDIQKRLAPNWLSLVMVLSGIWFLKGNCCV